eukprot:TRINITY_DN186_c1_g3_i1.p1 TRINITY_DN186_c1_g3~~TRINITY_DN186_c1_g3_i1.p1  ORF type:complete len:398 (-),score=94.09 TRINITY_DN186_c1_g3_i1:209-1264(-)
MSEETWKIPDDTRNKVLLSSRDIVYHFSGTRQRCVQMSVGKALYDLCKLFQKFLERYANRLREKLDSIEKGKAIDEQQQKLICFILNTAQYCCTTTKEVETSIRNDIDAKYKEKVNLQSTVDVFEGIISSSAVVLVKIIEKKISPLFKTTSTINWGGINSVNDQSEYVSKIITELSQAVSLIQKVIVQEHYLFLCRSISTYTVKAFEDSVMSIRGISDLGAEQLLSDVGNMKVFLQKLPTIGTENGETNERFSKLIEKQISPIEKVVQIVLSSKENLVETYKTMYPEPDVNHFVRILDMKGTPKTEQESYLDQYGVAPNAPIRITIRTAIQEESNPLNTKRLAEIFSFKQN